MKIYIYFMLPALLLLTASCKKNGPSPEPPVELSGTFKAVKVMEGSTVVFAEAGSSNIIPGYANYSITFDGGKAKLTEYSGQVFDGSWTYQENISTLTLSDLAPRPAAGNLVFKVEKIDPVSLVLSNSLPNPKTGDTINQYTLEKR